jgi:DDE superfamily endonuclease
VGKIANCQVAVSLSVATRSAHVPIGFELYLPESWTGDPVRREECKIPTDVVFRTKHDLALEMITRAVDDAVPGDVLLGDSGYGDSHNFRSRRLSSPRSRTIATRVPARIELRRSGLSARRGGVASARGRPGAHRSSPFRDVSLSGACGHDPRPPFAALSTPGRDARQRAARTRIRRAHRHHGEASAGRRTGRVVNVCCSPLVINCGLLQVA